MAVRGRRRLTESPVTIGTGVCTFPLDRLGMFGSIALPSPLGHSHLKRFRCSNEVLAMRRSLPARARQALSRRLSVDRLGTPAGRPLASVFALAGVLVFGSAQAQPAGKKVASADASVVHGDNA